MAMDAGAQIRDQVKEFERAFARGDVSGVAGLYTREGQLFPANSDVVHGTDAIRAFWQGAIDLGVKEVQLETTELEQHGDTAIETGRYRLMAAGGALADAGKYIVIWKNEGGVWKLHRDIWTTSQAAATA